MSDLCPTLDSLVALGFERWQEQSRPRSYRWGPADPLIAMHGLREPVPGTEAVVYEFAAFDLFCSHTMNKFMRMVVRVHGVIYTGRTLAEVDSEIPDNLEDPLEAVAWVSYVLSSHKDDLGPLPDWFVAGERNAHLVERAIEGSDAWERRQAYEASPKCYIDRDYARPLRHNLQENISWLEGEAEMTISFDGRVLSIDFCGRVQEVVAGGEGWPASYRVMVSPEAELPARFMSRSVVVSVFEGSVRFDGLRFGPCEPMT